MRKKIFLSVFALLLASLACGPFTTPTPTPRSRPSPVSNTPIPNTPVSNNPSPQTCSPDDPGAGGIGCISHVNDDLEKGASPSVLQPIFGIETLLNGDYLELKNGGKGVMEFGNSLKIIIFNDTQVGDIQLKSGSRFDLTLLLAFGGFLGNLDPGSGVAQVNTPNNGQIYVTGTQFFVVLDPNTGMTSVGNFDGQVQVDSGGVFRFLTPGFFLQFPPGGAPGPEVPIPFSPADFERQADSVLSPVGGFEDLTAALPDDQGDPILLAQQVIEQFGPECRVLTFTDGSEEATFKVQRFEEGLLEGGCESIFMTDIGIDIPDDEIVKMLQEIWLELEVNVLYFPIDQDTADRILRASLEVPEIDDVWMLDREGVKRRFVIR